MPFLPLQIRPGVTSQATPVLAGSASMFSSCQLVRFKDGLLQKLGGWQRIISETFSGVVRALVPFEDFNANKYLGAGSDQRLYVYTQGNLADITPIQQTNNLVAPFETVSSSTEVTVTDVLYNPLVGDWIYVVNPAAIDGVVLQGAYKVTAIVDPTHYKFDMASAASSSIPGGGTAALFSTLLASPDVTVTLANHGYTDGNVYTVYIATVVGGFTLFGQYSVTSVLDANNFIITPGGAATSNDSKSENGGNIKVNYLLPSGPSSTIYSYGVYGAGSYGVGPYNVGSSQAPIYLRYWSLSAWGIDMIASYNGGGLYFWDTAAGIVNNPATLVVTAPQNINVGIFVGMPEQQVIALGASVGMSADTDQLLVRWSDVGDYTSWTATSINQAGSYRLPRGSHIVGGLQGPQQILIWTDIGLWVMQYVQPPFVFSFNEIGEGCGLYGPKAMGILGGSVYWLSGSGFFKYDGNSLKNLPCSVWDIIFNNINDLQGMKTICAPNSAFNEISWYYASNTGNGEIDSYVKYNEVDGVWDYGTLIRTAWLDQSTWGNAIGVDGVGLMQQHETSNDADGTAIDSWAQSGDMKIEGGTLYTFLERVIPDFVYSGGNTVLLTFYFKNYPNGTIYTVGPLNATEAVNYLVVRGRGRLISVKIQSNDLGSFWRLGQILYSGSPDGQN